MRRFTTLSLLLLVAPFSWAQADSNYKLNKKIQQAGAQWVAGPTSVSHLSSREMRQMLDSSLDPHPEVQFEVPESALRSFASTPTWDWRNKDGKNWMSPIRHQGSCGSCMAFAAVGALEAQLRITQSRSYKLSPQFLFSCGGGRCNFGWYAEQAARFLMRTGVTEESCMPYMSSSGSDISCRKACGGAMNRTIKISSYSRPTSSARNLNAIREALKKGPLVTTMSVYRDFMSYRRGIYKRVSRSYVGGHAIVIIGYNDQERYLTIRNSWGTGWGESGYGRISYDDTSGLGSSTWKYEVPKPQVFALPMLNARLENEETVAIASHTLPERVSAEPDFALSRPLQSHNSQDSFELVLENRKGAFIGNIEFHQVHNGSKKVVPLSMDGEKLKIRLNAQLLSEGDWEFFVSAKDSEGRVHNSEKQVITIQP